MSTFPCLVRLVSGSGQVRYRLGDGLVDRYLEFVAGRSRPNTLRAVAFDLKTFFTVVGKDPVEVTAVDVFEFLAHQRGDRRVIRLADRESGLSARTIARRLSSVSGLYAYLVARGDTPVRVNPVPRGLLTRRQGGTMRSRVAPLVRVPRTLPRILSPEEADRLGGALRTHRDRAIVLAMLLAGLRRCEVLGLRFEQIIQLWVWSLPGWVFVRPGDFNARLADWAPADEPASSSPEFGVSRPTIRRILAVVPAPFAPAARSAPGRLAVLHGPEGFGGW